MSTSSSTIDAVQFNSTLHGILQKLNTLIESEVVALDEGRHEVLEEFASKKIHLFAQLEALGKRGYRGEVSQINQNEFTTLRERLVTNMRKLDHRIRAIKELTSTIEQAVLNDESDGTYSVGQMAMNGYV